MHPTKRLVYPFQQRVGYVDHCESVVCPEIEIDVQLAKIVEMIWALGIRTCGCCQGGDGEDAVISFSDCESADRFLFLIGGATNDHAFRHGWSWCVNPGFDGLGYKLVIGFNFPNGDIPVVEEILSVHIGIQEKIKTNLVTIKTNVGADGYLRYTIS